MNTEDRNTLRANVQEETSNAVEALEAAKKAIDAIGREMRPYIEENQDHFSPTQLEAIAAFEKTYKSMVDEEDQLSNRVLGVFAIVNSILRNDQDRSNSSDV